MKVRYDRNPRISCQKRKIEAAKLFIGGVMAVYFAAAVGLTYEPQTLVNVEETITEV